MHPYQIVKMKYAQTMSCVTCVYAHKTPQSDVSLTCCVMSFQNTHGQGSACKFVSFVVLQTFTVVPKQVVIIA